MKWILPLLLLANPAIIWQWVDNSGTVHITDNINQVPDPYYTIYQNRIAELKAQGLVQVNEQGEVVAMKSPQPNNYYYSAPSSTPAWNPSTQNLLAEEERQKAVWQNRVKSNRARLVELTNRYSELENKYSALKANPYMAALPQNRQQIQDTEAQKAALLQEMQIIKHRLEVEIPEAARKAGVPPGWVR